MVNVTINGKKIQVPKSTTIIDAAKQIGVHIPTLCYLKEINEIAACRVCVVEIEGKDKLITSCNNVVEEGMVVYTNSEKARRHRKTNVELILSQHNGNCVSCVRSQNCLLQKTANNLNIQKVPYVGKIEESKWDENFPLIRDASKCIKCMRCIQVCNKIQDLGVWDVEGTGSRTTVNVSKCRDIKDAHCSLCGQCITHCPVGALKARDDTEKVWRAIEEKNKIVIAQVAPAVRTAWGEHIGLSNDEATVGKILDALKKMGVDYAFDTVFSADLTIMEEGHEFLERFTRGELKDKPMFTSCCPGWVRYVKAEFPEFVKNLSTAKSPQQMFGSIMKSYFAKKLDINPENIYTISVMPCVAKKDENEMELYFEEFEGHNVDAVITTREFVNMLRASGIDPKSLENIPSDSVMSHGTGAGVLFGTTGGVMEAALRTAYTLVTSEKPPIDTFSQIRSEASHKNNGLAEVTYQIGDVTLNIAVVSGLGNTRKLLNKIKSGEKYYDFVEVMACPGGCVGGGGQPIHDNIEYAEHRGKELYKLDKEYKVRYSHENEDIIKLYEEYLGKPLSHKAHILLHTDHVSEE